MMDDLIAYLGRVPGVRVLSHGESEGQWWLKLSIDIAHPLAWRVVQELGHVLNYLSVEEPLDTVFKPVSPPPYLNGGPRAYLSWVIENTRESMTPALAHEWIEGRLPRPVDNEKKWQLGDD
jgi:hypothetical protein